VNQIGTLTETLDAVEMAKEAGYTAVTPTVRGDRGRDDSDIAVATNAARSRPGPSAARTRVAKYNQLLRIEEELGASAVYRRQALSPARRLRPPGAWGVAGRRPPAVLSAMFVEGVREHLEHLRLRGVLEHVASAPSARVWITVFIVSARRR